MILIGIGSNFAAGGFASPRDTADAAIAALPGLGIEIVQRSRWYESEPVPPSDQPWFVNGVAAVSTALEPPAMLATLLDLEIRFGRQRSVPNATRTLDLDLLDYDGRPYATDALTLPHPRLHERRFVLAPLVEIAPDWRHPSLDMTATELLGRLPAGQPVRAFGEGGMPAR